MKTYYLTSVTQQNDANEILIAMRNMLSPRAKVYLVVSQNAIVLSATPEDHTTAQRIIKDLDRPHKVYRLTFTLAESDSGKRVGIQHFSIVLVADQRTVLKQGDKIPVATGTYGKGNDPLQTQFQYLDIGISVDATLTDSPDGLQLKSKIEQSSLGQPSTIAGVQEPVIRQTVLEGTSAVKLNKPLALGGLDIESSTRHMDIEVVAEPVS
jgi:type II secretory pathway component GspD/PulD (secretin)